MSTLLNTWEDTNDKLHTGRPRKRKKLQHLWREITILCASMSINKRIRRHYWIREKIQMTNYILADPEKEKVAAFIKRNHSFAHISIEKYRIYRQYWIQGTTPKRATCYSYKLSDKKFSAEDEKYYMFTLWVTSKKRRCRTC